MADYSPFDYFGQFVAPLQKDRQLDIEQQQVKTQEALRKAQAAEAQRKLQQAALFQQDAQAVISNPTPEGYRALLLKYPDFHEGLKQAWDQYSEGQKDRNTEAASQVYATLQNGRPDLALQALKDRKAALAKAGESTEVTDQLISMIESGDPAKIKQAQGIAGFALANATGPDKIGSTLEALSNVQKGRTTTIDGILVNADTGEPIAQSPYPRIIPGPDGSFYEQPRASGIPTFGGATVAPGQAAGQTPSSPTAQGRAAPPLGSIGNPGGLKDGPFARSQAGYRGSNNGFAVFASPQDGIRAQETLLATKYLKAPKTAQQIVNIYASAGENSPASRRNYAKYIENRLGLAPGQKISADHIPQLAQAMREFETGNRAKTPARIASAAQYKQLPSGATYYDPKGNLRRKP
jgi:hypothetical protein